MALICFMVNRKMNKGLIPGYLAIATQCRMIVCHLQLKWKAIETQLKRHENHTSPQQQIMTGVRKREREREIERPTPNGETKEE